jgi:hypothetical protein
MGYCFDGRGWALLLCMYRAGGFCRFVRLQSTHIRYALLDGVFTPKLHAVALQKGRATAKSLNDLA